jgi:hypothetical protein
MNTRVFAIVLLSLVATASTLLGQERLPYDGIQAGLDAYRLAEERRRGAIADQLYFNDEMRAWAGLPTSRGETIYYGLYGPRYGYAYPPTGLDFRYAYGLPRYAFRPLTVFEPWPIVPGDIYGYPAYTPVRQPIGQHQEQTGPNRWESHPVYDPPITPYRPLPPVVDAPTEPPPAADQSVIPSFELPPPAPVPYRER